MKTPASRSPTSRSGEKLAIRQKRGAKARHDGRSAEVVAALWLIAKGWRVLGFRVTSPQGSSLGEIDLLARRGGVLAVIEVKRRATLEAALEAVTPTQRARLRAAGESLAARRPDFASLAVRLDLVALAPGRLPRHVPDAWPQDGGRG